MRIVSWMVVVASASVLAWQGLAPFASELRLPPVDALDAVGSIANRAEQGSMGVERVTVANGEAFDFEFSGSSSRNSPEFEIEGPWILDWRVSQDGGFELAVDVSLEAAGTGVHQGSVLKTKHPGNGVRLFEEGGHFYFRVHSSFARWTLRVKALTPEEAAQYTPRDGGA